MASTLIIPQQNSTWSSTSYRFAQWTRSSEVRQKVWFRYGRKTLHLLVRVAASDWTGDEICIVYTKLIGVMKSNHLREIIGMYAILIIIFICYWYLLNFLKKKNYVFCVLLIQFAYLHKVQADQALICYGYTLSTHFK